MLLAVFAGISDFKIYEYQYFALLLVSVMNIQLRVTDLLLCCHVWVV